MKTFRTRKHREKTGGEGLSTAAGRDMRGFPLALPVLLFILCFDRVRGFFSLFFGASLLQHTWSSDATVSWSAVERSAGENVRQGKVLVRKTTSKGHQWLRRQIESIQNVHPGCVPLIRARSSFPWTVGRPSDVRPTAVGRMDNFRTPGRKTFGRSDGGPSARASSWPALGPPARAAGRRLYH